MLSTIFILAIFGILSLLAELVLPGGVLGVVGFLCLIGAAALSFAEYGFLVGVLVTVAIIVFSFALLWLWMKYFHLLPGTKSLVMKSSLSRGDSSPEPEALIGQRGKAITEIGPSGRAQLGDDRFDVIAESTAIAKGTPVEFLRRSGPSWVVRPAADTQSS